MFCLSRIRKRRRCEARHASVARVADGHPSLHPLIESWPWVVGDDMPPVETAAEIYRHTFWVSRGTCSFVTIMIRRRKANSDARWRRRWSSTRPRIVPSALWATQMLTPMSKKAFIEKIKPSSPGARAVMLTRPTTDAVYSLLGLLRELALMTDLHTCSSSTIFNGEM